MDTLLTPKEIGARLGVSEVTIFRLYDSGALNGVVVRAGKRKRTIRFRPEAVEQFIASREKRPGRAEVREVASGRK